MPHRVQAHNLGAAPRVNTYKENLVASDQQVTASVVLETLLEVQRIGPARAMQRLEQVEPDLMEFLLEDLSQLHHRLLDLGGPAKKSRRIFHQVERLALVCVESMRKGHFRLWQASVEDTPLARLDDSPSQSDAPFPLHPPSSSEAGAQPD